MSNPVLIRPDRVLAQIDRNQESPGLQMAESELGAALGALMACPLSQFGLSYFLEPDFGAETQALRASSFPALPESSD